MPTATKVPQAVPPQEDALDVRTMRSFHDAPTLAPLLAQRTALKERLATINAEVVACRRALHRLEERTDFTTISTRRQVTHRLNALEEEGAQVEQALAPLLQEIDAVEPVVKAALTGLLADEGLPVVQAFVQALEQLASASAAYTAFSQRSWHVTGSRLVPADFIVRDLPRCIKRAQQVQERLLQLRGRA